MTARLPESIARLADRTGPRAAAFDADGVLWRGDVSEDFTRWMIERGDFDESLWAGYEQTNRADPAAGCIDILRFYRGQPMAALRDRIAEFWSGAPPRPWIAPVIAAFRWLADRGFSMYVVSATPRIVLDPLVDYLPVVASNILALELEADERDCATGAPRGTVTCGTGKAERLRAASAEPMLVAVGNSRLDVEMLRLGQAVQWAVDPDPVLRAEAERSGWLILENSHG